MWLLPKLKKEIEEVMDYTFDTIKSRWTLALVVFFILLFPIIPFVILNVRAWFPIPSSIFISFGIPMLLSAFISLLIARNKQKLFWTRINLSLNKKESNFEINQKKFSFNDLEYFTYRRGSSLTTGIKRSVLFLKFKSGNIKVIMPCKSSTKIENYDRFIKEFEHIRVENNFKSRALF